MKVLRRIIDNPVLTLELCRFSWRWLWLTLMSAGAVMSVGTGLAFSFDVTCLLPVVGGMLMSDGERTWHELMLGYSPLWLMNWLTPVYVLARLGLPMRVAPSIAAERERGTLDSLLLIPSSRHSIIWGKGLAACLPFAVLLCGAVMGVLLFSVVDGFVTVLGIRHSAHSDLTAGLSAIAPALPATFACTGVMLSSSIAGVAVSTWVPRTYYAYILAPLVSLMVGGIVDYLGGLCLVHYISSGGWALGIESIPEGVLWWTYRFPVSHHIRALTVCAAAITVANIAAAGLFAILAAKRLERG